jgi:hypothetical protein
MRKDLLVLARDVSDLTRLRVDRQAKRNRDCLLCWFCENWRTIEPMLPTLRKSRPGEYDTRPKIPRFPDLEPDNFLGCWDESVDDLSYPDCGMDY